MVTRAHTGPGGAVDLKTPALPFVNNKFEHGGASCGSRQYGSNHTPERNTIMGLAMTFGIGPTPLPTSPCLKIFFGGAHRTDFNHS